MHVGQNLKKNVAKKKLQQKLKRKNVAVKQKTPAPTRKDVAEAAEIPHAAVQQQLLILSSILLQHRICNKILLRLFTIVMHFLTRKSS